MKKTQKFFILLIFALFIILFSGKVYAGSQRWNALDYSVVLNEDGSADIVETWDVSISSTNTMFKDFDFSNDSSYYIDNVKVSRIVDGMEIPLREIFVEQYHVDSGCYYGLMLEDDKFEIAWNVGLDNSSARRVYKMYYTVHNAVKVYSDCSEFYWKFLSDENTMAGDNITGTITFPRGVTDIDKIHIWGHGDFSGNTERNSTDTVSFSMDHLSANSMLEIRAVIEDNVFETATNVYINPKLDDILKEEAKWANEANAKRMFWKGVIAFVIVVTAIAFIYYITKIVEYVQAGKEIKMMAYPKNDLKYFRDIPNEENATPARASYMYYFGHLSSRFESYTTGIFSATILQLTLKKYISLEPIDKSNVRIKILSRENLKPLEKDEELIYGFIVDNSNGTGYVETEALEKYASKHYEKFHKLMREVCKAAQNYKELAGAIDYDRKKLTEKWSNKNVFYIMGAMFLSFFGIAVPFLYLIVIEFIICAVLCTINSRRISILSPQAYEEVNRWKGLVNYMMDFSLLKEKQVPDLILWEKYLVYATAFGISKEVIEQLVKVYPQMTSEEYYRSGNYTYLYMASNSGFDGLKSLDSSISSIARTANSAYSSAHSSSSGGGGGFSGGGGGRRRRW